MVVAVVAGQVADGFLGAMPEAQVKEWLGQVMQVAEQLGLQPAGAPAGRRRRGPGRRYRGDSRRQLPPGYPGGYGDAGADAIFTEAQEAMERGDMDSAASAFEKVLAASPGDPVATMGLGQVSLIRRVERLRPGHRAAGCRSTAWRRARAGQGSRYRPGLGANRGELRPAARHHQAHFGRRAGQGAQAPGRACSRSSRRRTRGSPRPGRSCPACCSSVVSAGFGDSYCSGSLSPLPLILVSWLVLADPGPAGQLLQGRQRCIERGPLLGGQREQDVGEQAGGLRADALEHVVSRRGHGDQEGAGIIRAGSLSR